MANADYRLTLPAASLFTSGVWAHHAFAWNSATPLHAYYLNASQQGSSSSAFSTESVSTLYLGNFSGTQAVNGAIAEWALWNVQLSANELSALASGVRPARVRPGSLALYYPLFGLASPEPCLLPGSTAYSLSLTGTAQANHAPVTLFTKKARTEFDAASGNTSLSLAVQSAAWTNATLTQLSALALAGESAAWTNPALAPQSLLSLAVESAAWTANGLSLSSALAVASESAAWTNPALAQTLAVAVAAQSASWTNPQITVPGGLQLATQTASWTNPGLTTAATLALAAESAGWTNPTLNAALALTVATQAAAWNNPAITPVGGAGVVVLLPGQSAAWTLYPLGLFSCPTILNPFMGRESCVISNTEVVTLYRRLSDGTFDGGTLVGQALRLDIGKELAGGAAGLLSRNELDWYLWSAQVGLPAVKDGDVIQDAYGVRWSIWRTDVQAWGNRYQVKTKQER